MPLRLSRSLLWLAVALGVAAPAALSEGEAKVSFHVSAESRPAGVNHVFVIEGAVNLPEGTHVQAELLYCKQTKSSPRVLKETGKELTTEEVTVDEGSQAVASGRFSFNLGLSTTPPYAGDYVLALRVPTERQPENAQRFLAEVGEVPEFRHPFTVGRLEELEGQRRSVADSIHADMVELYRLGNEGKERFQTLVKDEKSAADDFSRWQAGGWDARLGQVQARNQLRSDKDLYWLEYYGKRYINLLISDLRALAGVYRETLAARDPKSVELVASREQDFFDTFGMWMEYLQFPMPRDNAESRRQVEALRKLLQEFAAWFSQTAATSPPDPIRAHAETQEWQGRIVAAIAALTQTLPDFEFAPMAGLTRDSVRMMRDAHSATVDADATAGERTRQALTKLLQALQGVEDDLRVK